MRRSWLSAVLVSALALAGCGGSHHHPRVSNRAPAVVTGGLQSAGGSVHPPGWGHPPPGAHEFPQAAPPSTLTGTAEQFDTVTLASVPRGARYLAGYTAGFWPTYNPLRALPWHPHVVSIAIHLRYHAQCLDIEPGDAAPSEAAAWYFAVLHDPSVHKVGGKPCEYSSFWEFTNQIIPVLDAAHIARSAIWEWDANFTYVRHLDRGFDCTQWSDKAHGLNLDESTCVLAFLGARTGPPPDPYAIYPKPRFLLVGGVIASEHNTVATWYHSGCEDPARRPVCKSSHYHAQLLRDREWFVAHHHLTAHGWVALRRARWADYRLGERFKGLSKITR